MFSSPLCAHVHRLINRIRVRARANPFRERSEQQDPLAAIMSYERAIKNGSGDAAVELGKLKQSGCSVYEHTPCVLFFSPSFLCGWTGFLHSPACVRDVWA